jgi:hypothetical protein
VHPPGVTRLRNSSNDATAGGGPPAGAWGPPAFDPGPAPGIIDVEGPASEHYAVRPVRPAAQLAARIGLWTAVVLGCLGGIVGAVRPSAEAAAPVVEQFDDGAVVPAPVAGVAELAVGAWLTATVDDEERLDALFVENVSTRDIESERLTVAQLTIVAGRQVEDGYWAVTVAADVAEVASAPAVPGEPPATSTTTWFVEVGVVGEVDGGLSALTTPAVLPAPPAVAEEWQSNTSGRSPEQNDPVVATVQGFLAALLTGEGDPSRYLAPGETIAAADPAPFAELVVLEMAITDLDDGRARVWTQVQVTTPGGSRQVVAYEVLVAQRVDRWEVVEISGVPTSVEAPPTESGSDDSSEDPDDSGSPDGSSSDDDSSDTTDDSSSDATTEGTSSDTTAGRSPGTTSGPGGG